MILDPYATHVPVLRALGAALPITCILECGAGEYSTPLLLDRIAFPLVTRVDSLESDWTWLMRVKEAAQEGRLWLTYTGGRMAHYVETMDLSAYDLILIDSGAVIADRLPVIAAVMAQRPRAVVLLHDYDRPEYQGASAGFEGRRVFTGLRPWTAVLWFGDRPELEALAL